MNKREREELEQLRLELLRAKALRFTEPVEPDVKPPETSSELRKGWLYNAYNDEVAVACTSSVSHSSGRDDKTATKRPCSLYSTKLLALKALRAKVEQQVAKRLADIDARIAQEQEANHD